jgi:transposase-like protein
MSVQLITPNQRKARRFSPQQKLQILKEWEREGTGIEVAQRYQLHPHTLYRWKKLLEQGAETFLRGTRPRPDPYLKRLEKKNQKLKEALALQTQELMLLKKEMNLV